MTDLVVGASGFVGAPLVSHLRSRQRDVVRCDVHPADDLDELVALHDRGATAALIERVAPERVFLVAEAEDAVDPWAAGEALYRLRADGTAHLLLACRRHAPGCRVLYLSSARVYGLVPQEAMPLREDRPLYPSDPDGSSLALAERLCRAFGREGRIHVVVARHFDLAGRGSTTHGPLTALVERIVALSRGQGDALIRSDVVETSRDLIHVDDAVRALDGLLERGASGEVYNVCSGTGSSLGALARTLLGAAGVRARIEPSGSLPAMHSAVWQGDARRLEDALGWVPAPVGEDTVRDLLRRGPSAARPGT